MERRHEVLRHRADVASFRAVVLVAPAGDRESVDSLQDLVIVYRGEVALHVPIADPRHARARADHRGCAALVGLGARLADGDARVAATLSTRASGSTLSHPHLPRHLRLRVRPGIRCSSRARRRPDRCCRSSMRARCSTWDRASRSPVPRKDKGCRCPPDRPCRAHRCHPSRRQIRSCDRRFLPSLHHHRRCRYSSRCRMRQPQQPPESSEGGHESSGSPSLESGDLGTKGLDLAALALDRRDRHAHVAVKIHRRPVGVDRDTETSYRR